MEALTCYRVGEQLFTNKEVASLYETLNAMPTATQFTISDKNIGLTINLSVLTHLGVLIDKDGRTISFANAPIYMTNEHFLELNKRGISWLVKNNIQTFIFGNKENLVDDFLFLYKYTKELEDDRLKRL